MGIGGGGDQTVFCLRWVSESTGYDMPTCHRTNGGSRNTSDTDGLRTIHGDVENRR